MTFINKDASIYVAVGIGVGVAVGWFLRGKLRPKFTVMSSKNGLNEVYN